MEGGRGEGGHAVYVDGGSSRGRVLGGLGKEAGRLASSSRLPLSVMQGVTEMGVSEVKHGREGDARGKGGCKGEGWVLS
ncbi:hypothetical protein Naga_100133g1 [Nannochloropsis gaditana]|uniref:Uncharacterized protein n=1 Tax=Nannochloropsis gaditana TaxID=72520 RepID=W7U7R0_9STRA|nr:hypothetical protein Naga_100133g1 [Nannochloropsis gaditana]